MTEKAEARRIRVRGRVQGVGYRYFCLDLAQRRGLAGWVRNRTDGSVEIEAQGPAAALDIFLEELKRGPSLARVDRVDWQPAAINLGLDEFAIKDTSI